MTAPFDQQTTAPRSAASRSIMIVTSIVGGCVLLATGVSTAVSSSVTRTGLTASAYSQEVSGITGLEIAADLGDFTLEFADVDRASLAVSGVGRGQWTMERDGDELRIESPSGFTSMCFLLCTASDQRIVLTLPETLKERKIDAEISLNAGSMRAEGSFGDLDFDMSAGKLDFEGSARTLTVDMTAGSANARLTGTPPTSVDIDMTAGRFDLHLPEGTYRVTQDVSAGTVDNQLDTSSSAKNAVNIELSAGTVNLRQAD